MWIVSVYSYLMLSLMGLLFWGNRTSGYTDKDLILCETYDDCRASCGVSAMFFKCHSSGYCSCLNTVGVPASCVRLNSEDRFCKKMCGEKRSAKRCMTDAGRFCTCFQRKTTS